MRTLATTIAGSFALTAFTIAVFAGLASEVRAGSVLFRGLVAMITCYPVGFAVGLVAERVIRDHVLQIDAEDASPELSDDASPSAPADHEEEEVLVV